jgi:Glycosyl hydrolase family 3 C-terminal domain
MASVILAIDWGPVSAWAAAGATLLGTEQIEFDPGMNPAEAALVARRSDVVIAFGIRVEGEGYDNADLALPWDQDAVIDAVARHGEGDRPGVVPLAGRRPGDRRSAHRRREPLRSSADHLPGRLRPDPRPELPGLGTPWRTPVMIEYNEGADVGYRWFAKQTGGGWESGQPHRHDAVRSGQVLAYYPVRGDDAHVQGVH